MEKKSSGAMEEPSKQSPSLPVMMRRGRGSYLAAVYPPTNPMTAVTFSCCESQCEEEEEQESPHFLDACTLCRSPLGRGRDIFMYRGDTPFCSEECRQEQIELDGAREEEKAGYWRSRRRRQRRSPRLLLRERPDEPAEVQSIHAPAPETAVAG